MAHNQAQDEKEFLRKLVEYLSKMMPELVKGINTEPNKVQYLRCTILGKQWATIPLNNNSTSHYQLD